jgi:diguanylate cyclase (GGDEF)-like protein
VNTVRRAAAAAAARASAPASTAAKTRPRRTVATVGPGHRATATRSPRPAARPTIVRKAPRTVTLRSFVATFPTWVKIVLALLVAALAVALGAIMRSRRQLTAALARAHHDVVTGLPNRAAADETLKLMAARSARCEESLAVVMVDLDHFKSINDDHGHATGDQVLAAVGAVARQSMRGSDFVARFGGEELILILPDTDLRGARLVAEKLRTALHDVEVGQLDRRVTASFGVAAAHGDVDELRMLVPRADAALYCAKANGRDRVETADSPTAEPVPA